jgi:hypothetical protein
MWLSTFLPRRRNPVPGDQPIVLLAFNLIRRLNRTAERRKEPDRFSSGYEQLANIFSTTPWTDRLMKYRDRAGRDHFFQHDTIGSKLLLFHRMLASSILKEMASCIEPRCSCVHILSSDPQTCPAGSWRPRSRLHPPLEEARSIRRRGGDRLSCCEPHGRCHDPDASTESRTTPQPTGASLQAV